MTSTFFVAQSRDQSHHALVSSLERCHRWKRIIVENKNCPKKTESRKSIILKTQKSAQEESETSNLARPSTSALAGSGFYIGSKFNNSNSTPPSWLWTLSEKDVDWVTIAESQTVNHFQCVSQLTTKAGLSATMQELHWHVNADHRTFYPRSYQLSDLSDRRAFVLDLRRTAAATVLRLHLTIHTLPCAPILVGIALKAVIAWTDDLRRRFQLDHDDRLLEVDDQSKSEYFDSDGISTVEWNELLDYCEYLMEVGDAVEIGVRQHRQSKTPQQDSADLNHPNKQQEERTYHHLPVSDDASFRKHWFENAPTVVSSAIEKFQSRLMNRSKKTVTRSVGKANNNNKKKTRYRPCGIPTLAEIPQLIQPKETSDEIRARQVWCQVETFEAAKKRLYHNNEVSSAVSLLSTCWPQACIDNLAKEGSLPRNTWIVKAPGTSRGAGLQLSRKLSSIIGRSHEMGGRVVQKYIENPLLTYKKSSGHCIESESSLKIPRGFRRPGKKFDLRQWVLLVGPRKSDPFIGGTTRDVPPRCYVFEPCYARRCQRSLRMTADALKDRLAHLSNYSIQKGSTTIQSSQLLKKSASQGLDSPVSPNPTSGETFADGEGGELMWTEEELLAELGLEPSTWDAVVKPALRGVAKTMASAVLPSWSDPTIGGRAQCFELIGVPLCLFIVFILESIKWCLPMFT